MTRNEIIAAARQTTAPLWAEIARLQDQIHAREAMGYERHMQQQHYEAIESNRREIDRWTAYFAQMLAVDPGPPPFIVSADRVADEFRELTHSLKATAKDGSDHE